MLRHQEWHVAMATVQPVSRFQFDVKNYSSGKLAEIPEKQSCFYWSSFLCF